MKQHILTIRQLTLSILILIALSCDNYLDVKPKDQFLQEKVFQDETLINQALNGIYLHMVSPALYGNELSMGTIDVLAQYYNCPAQHQKAATASYQYNNAAVTETFSNLWKTAYTSILNVNSFIEQLSRSNGILAEERKQVLLGEAYGLRAFLHLDLLRLYGPVYSQSAASSSIPYLSKPTEAIQPLRPASAVMDSILKDIEVSIQKLAADPVRTSGIQPATSSASPDDSYYKTRNRRFNYYAALALKARTALYAGNRPAALESAKALLAEALPWFPWTPESQTAPGLNNPDRIFSSEIIFGVQHPSMQQQYLNLFDASLSDQVILAPESQRLIEFYGRNASDYRYRSQWVLVPSSSKNYRTFVKYRQEEPVRNLLPLIRLSEIYLIAAECEPDPDQAIVYLNTVKTHRGELLLTAPIDLKETLYSAYRKEFWGEGQLFFFLKRTFRRSVEAGNPDLQILSMDEANYVIPIPLVETQNR